MAVRRKTSKRSIRKKASTGNIKITIEGPVKSLMPTVEKRLLSKNKKRIDTVADRSM